MMCGVARCVSAGVSALSPRATRFQRVSRMLGAAGAAVSTAGVAFAAVSVGVLAVSELGLPEQAARRKTKAIRSGDADILDLQSGGDSQACSQATREAGS